MGKKKTEFYNTPEYKEKQRIKKIGNKNGMWKGGISRSPFEKIYKNVAKSLEQKCSLCSIKTKLIVHHIDNNYRNNKLNNLMIVCKGCHNKIHKKGVRIK